MFRILLCSIIIFSISCKDQRLQQYEQIVNDADRFEISYQNNTKKIAVPEQQTNSLKDVLKRNIRPEYQRKFLADIRIDFYKNDKRIAFLITNEHSDSFVNFHSDKLNFCFRLTYGIGMFIGNSLN